MDECTIGYTHERDDTYNMNIIDLLALGSLILADDPTYHAFMVGGWDSDKARAQTAGYEIHWFDRDN